MQLQIYQEVSSVAQRGEATDIVTNTRSLRTTVVAENNRMLVLGGLIQDDVLQNRQKVPILGDIPILGNLFRYRSDNRRKTNLLIFLRPRIIRGSADMDGPTQRKYQYLEEITREQELREKPVETVRGFAHLFDEEDRSPCIDLVGRPDRRVERQLEPVEVVEAYLERIDRLFLLLSLSD